MSHIYITDNGATVTVDGGRLKIMQKDGVVKSVPKETVESISIFENSSITTPCIQFLLTEGISVCYFSSNGKHFGRLVSTSDNKVDVIKHQIEAFDDRAFAFELGKRIAEAKIHNQTVVLKRYIKEVTPELNCNVSLLKVYKKKVEQAADINQLMGYEGIAARTYFDSISMIIDPGFAFSVRSKRPPRDKFNSLLSFGYTLLLYEIYAKIQIVGLTPYYSIIHQSYGDHLVLASDLMEEWRAVIVDSAVLSMIQGHEVGEDDFLKGDESGIYLTKNGLKKFIKKFERKLNTDIKYLHYDDRTYSMRDALNIQCKKLRESIYKREPSVYIPILLK